MHYSILQNAIDSIQVGVEDYKSNDRKRVISAVRNIVSGMLLLFKEELRRKSPYDEILIKSKIIPFLDEDGELKLKAQGQNTVDVDGILKRFKELNIQIDSKSVEKITKERNNIEHYYSELPTDKIREFIVDTFKIIFYFIEKTLNDFPQNILGEDVVNIILEEEKIYNDLKESCLCSFKSINFDNPKQSEILKKLHCTKCGAGLLSAKESDVTYSDMSLKCLACGHIFVFSEDIERIVEDSYGAENYISIKDGGDAVNGLCPECDLYTYIYSEEICIACAYEPEYTECVRCGNLLDIEEQELGGLCSYCNHIYQKTMNE